MKIGLLQVDLRMEGCDSLKDKRAILQSIKSRLRSQYNVSVAEIDDLDVWRSSRLGLVAIGNGATSIERIFRSVLTELDRRRDIEVIGEQIEML